MLIVCHVLPAITGSRLHEAVDREVTSWRWIRSIQTICISEGHRVLNGEEYRSVHEQRYIHVIADDDIHVHVQ